MTTGSGGLGARPSLSLPCGPSGVAREEIAALPGISRHNANRCLKPLEGEGLLKLEFGGVSIIDLEYLPGCGE